MTERFEIPVECRASDYDGPGRLTGTILEVGRIASDRAEVFAPGAPIFPSTGVTLYRGHRGTPIMTFQPSLTGPRSRSTRRSPIPNWGDKSRRKSATAREPRCPSNFTHWTKRGSWACAS